ncbi:MAG: hypothetical protein ABR567_13675 [Myxococcales bacterium]
MTLRRAAPAIVGLVLLVVFFASTFDPRVQLYYRDTGRLYYPVKLYIAQHLRAGSLPLWDTMVESGVSLLGQVTPGLLHPATLLYLVFPFDVAFKLNHALGPLLGGIGAWLLARRLGASPWAALAAAIAYGGCGYVISMTGSNLPYSLGAGQLPLAIDAGLAFVEQPRLGRFAWAGAAFALIAYAGEPQATVIAGLLTAVWAVLEAGEPRRAARNLGLVAACGGLAFCLAAPAVLPGWYELKRSSRAHGLSAHDQSWFANHPLRLAGLLVPRAFDDETDATAGDSGNWVETFPEYFGTPSVAFSDSIVIGAPAILLALAAAWGRRRGKLLLLGAAVFALASTGLALGIDRVLFAAVPMASIFRFSEKLVGPASLLLALAAALGADLTLGGTRRAAARLGLAALAFAAGAALAAMLLAAHVGGVVEAILPYGRTHSPHIARLFVDQLRAGLLDAAELSIGLAAAAAWRYARQRPAIGLAPLSCAASVFASCGGLLYTAPVEYLHGPFDLAEQLKSIAGPSPGSWRIFTQFTNAPGFKGVPARVQTVLGLSQALMPQYNSVAQIESVAAYFSAGEPHYLHAVSELPEKYFELFDVRFAIEMPISFSEKAAAERGFRRMGFGYWVKQYPPRQRAFVAGRATRVDTVEESMKRLSEDSFRFRAEAVITGAAAPSSIAGQSGPARLERPSAEHIRVAAQGPGLLVVGEHFDPGWRARVGSTAAPVLETDLTAIGVPLPPGPTTVDLRFVPVGLIPGVVLFAAGLVTLFVIRLTIRVRPLPP